MDESQGMRRSIEGSSEPGPTAADDPSHEKHPVTTTGESPRRVLGRKLTADGLMTSTGGDGSPVSASNLKEKVAQLQMARRSSYGASQAPKWEGLEGVKLADRIQGLSASLSGPTVPATIEEPVRPGKLPPSRVSALAASESFARSPIGGLRSGTGSPSTPTKTSPPKSAPVTPIRFLGFTGGGEQQPAPPQPQQSPASAVVSGPPYPGDLLKNSVLLTIDVPALGNISKLRFRASSSVEAAKQVVHRKLAKDVVLGMSFWHPITGIFLRPERTLQEHLLRNGDRLVLEKDPCFAGSQSLVPVEMETTHIVESVPYYKDTNALGVLQWLTRKDLPLIQAPLYGLWRPKDNSWIDELRTLSSCGLEPLETLILKRRYATAAEAPYKLDDVCKEETPSITEAQPQTNDTPGGRARFRTTSASFMKVKEEIGSKINITPGMMNVLPPGLAGTMRPGPLTAAPPEADPASSSQSADPPFDPAGSIIVVKVTCANNNFTTMLRVGTKDNADTLRARLKKRMDDIHTYDIWLPNQGRMPEHTHLEYHGIKEKDLLELHKKPAEGHPEQLPPEPVAEEAPPRPSHKKRNPSMGKSEGLKSVFGRLKKDKDKEKEKEKEKERERESLLPPPVGLPPAVAQPLVSIEEKDPAPPFNTVLRGDDKRKTKIWGRERELLTSFFKNRPDKDELLAKKILVQDGGLEDVSIPLSADIVSRTIEWLGQQEGFFELEGIFRISGTSTAVKHIWLSFRGSPDEIDFKEAATPHDVCGALKHYFRESPEPLIPYENHSAFVAAGQMDDERKCADALKAAVLNLPEDHKRMTKELFRFLNKVMKFQDKNKMSANNLGIVFGPSIMRNRSNTVDFFSTGHQSAASCTMVQHYPYIFEGREWGDNDQLSPSPRLSPISTGGGSLPLPSITSKTSPSTSPRAALTRTSSSPNPKSLSPTSSALPRSGSGSSAIHLPALNIPAIINAPPRLNSPSTVSADREAVSSSARMLEIQALLAQINLSNRSDSSSLSRLAKQLHALYATDDQVSEVMEKELTGAKLVGLCLGFAKVISEKSERRHEKARSESGSGGRAKHERKHSETRVPSSPRVTPAPATALSPSSTALQASSMPPGAGEKSRHLARLEDDEADDDRGSKGSRVRKSTGPKKTDQRVSVSKLGDADEEGDAEDIRKVKRQPSGLGKAKSKIDPPQGKRKNDRRSKGGSRRCEDSEAND